MLATGRRVDYSYTRRTQLLRALRTTLPRGGGTMPDFVTLPSLWLPILLSAVAVFVVSSVIHMLLPYHRSDFAKLPDEEALRNSMRPLNIPPDNYIVPHAATLKEMDAAEHKRKLEEGPVALLLVQPTGPWSMGTRLGSWFAYCIIVGIVAGYVAGRALEPGAEYLDVFRFAGTAAFAAYALALPQNSIWYGLKWSTTLKSMFDGAVFALITAGMFGWLWPGA
jgi:hypothetical protein